MAVSPLLLAAGCCGVVLNLERLHAAGLSQHRGAEVAFEKPPSHYAQRLDAEEDQYSNLTAADFESMVDPSAAQPSWALAEGECGDAHEGSSCYHAVMWLLMGGFERHPDWYPDYSTESSFREVQSMLHIIGKGHCTEPCKLATQGQQAPVTSTSALPAPPGCHDTVEGEWCFQSLAWLKARGIQLHHAWFPNLHNGSTIGEMQAELHKMGKSNCEAPCTLQHQSIQDEENSSERGNASDQDPASQSTAESQDARKEAPNKSEACDDAEPLSQCHLAVKYAVSEGIRTQPEMFPSLSPDATFKQVQESFYLRGVYACKKPCPIPDTKKAVDQMSEEELARYLSGEWDGMVKAAADSLPERAGEAPAVVAEGVATVDAGAQPDSARGEAEQSLSRGRLSEALQRNFGTKEGVTVEGASKKVPGAPQKAEAGSTETANPIIDPASRGAPEVPGSVEVTPTRSVNLTTEAASEGAPSMTGAALTGDATITVTSPHFQEAPLPAVPSVDRDRRSEEAITTTQMAVSPEESAARLKQQVLWQLQQAENETKDPQVMTAIRRAEAEFQTASSGALKGAEDNHIVAESQKAGDTKMSELIDYVKAAAHAAWNLTEVSRAAISKRASQHVPLESGSESDLLPYVDNDGREKTIAEIRAGMEQNTKDGLESQFGGQQRTTTPPEDMTAGLTDQKFGEARHTSGGPKAIQEVFGELAQAQSTTIQKVETEEEMTARLSKQMLEEISQAQSTTTQNVETEEEMTARLSKQVLGDIGQTKSTMTQKVETEEEMTARLSKQMLDEIGHAQSTTTQKVETEESMMARLRKQVLEEFEAQNSQNSTSRAETLEEITDRLSKHVAAKFDGKQ